MSVSYDSKKLIPAPFVRIVKSYQDTGGDIHVGATYDVELIGKIFSNKGSPTSSGFWTLSGYPADEIVSDPFSTLLRKKEQLTNLFANAGRWLEIQACDSSAPVKGRPRVLNINFSDGPWYDYIDYSIALQCDELFGASGSADYVYSDGYFIVNNQKIYLKTASEEWNTEFTDQHSHIGVPVFNVTRRVNAIGKLNWDSNGNEISAYTSAKRWVEAQSGIYESFLHNSSGLNIPANYCIYNHIRAESQDKLGGAYGLSESWVIVSGTVGVIEDYNISVQDSLDSALTSVSIDGSIRGLESIPRYASGNYVNVHHTKWHNASGYYNSISSGLFSEIYKRALLYSNVGWLNTQPKSIALGKNMLGGTINYTYAYDTRPETTGLIPGCKSASFIFDHGLPIDVFGSVPIPGRVAGPILQPLDMKGSRKTSLAVDVFMPPFTGMWLQANISGVLACPAYTPVNTFCTGIYEYIKSLSAVGNNNVAKIFVQQDSDNWQPLDRHYTRNITWEYELRNGVIHVG